MQWSALAAVCCAASILGCATGNGIYVSAQSYTVPGKGQIQVGMSRVDLIRVLGLPDRVQLHASCRVRRLPSGSVRHVSPKPPAADEPSASYQWSDDAPGLRVTISEGSWVMLIEVPERSVSRSTAPR